MKVFSEKVRTVDYLLSWHRLGGYSHKFYEREDVIEKLVTTAKSNFEARGDMSKSMHTMVLIPGGAGWESQFLATHPQVTSRGWASDTEAKDVLFKGQVYHFPPS